MRLCGKGILEIVSIKEWRQGEVTGNVTNRSNVKFNLTLIYYTKLNFVRTRQNDSMKASSYFRVTMFVWT